MGAIGLKCNFFFFKFATKSLEKKKGGPVAPPTSDRVLSPEAVAHPSGDRPLSPVGGATGSYVWPTKPIELHKIPPASEDLL